MIYQYKNYQVKDAMKRDYMKDEVNSGTIQVVKQEAHKETLLKRYTYGKGPTDRTREQVIEVAKQFVQDQLLIGLKATMLRPDAYLRMIGLTEGMEGTIYDVRRNMNGRRTLRLGILFGDKQYFLRRDEVLIENLPTEDRLDVKASVWKPCTYEELPKDKNILVAYTWQDIPGVLGCSFTIDYWSYWYSDRVVPEALMRTVHHYLETDLSPDFFNPTP